MGLNHETIAHNEPNPSPEMTGFKLTPSYHIEPNFYKMSKSIMMAVAFYSKASASAAASRQQLEENSKSHPQTSRRASFPAAPRKMITLSSVLTYVEFVGLFMAFNLRTRKDLRDLYSECLVGQQIGKNTPLHRQLSVRRQTGWCSLITE